jgi:hypothetical protein
MSIAITADPSLALYDSLTQKIDCTQRRPMKALISCLILLLSCSTIAFAEDSSPYTGANLRKGLATYVKLADNKIKPSGGDESNMWMMIGYAEAFEATSEIYQAMITSQVKGTKRLYCIPDGTTRDKRLRVIAKYLDNNPDNINQHLPKLIGDAFIKYFPCK